MTRFTAILILTGGDQITCDSSGRDPRTGKYAAWVTFWVENRPHISPLLMSEFSYDTSRDAKHAAEDIVRTIRERGDLLFVETPTRAIVVPFAMLPHSNANALSIVPISATDNYVARTEDWQGVTRAVYIPVGSIVDTSRPEFSWLSSRGSTVMIEPLNIRGVWSSGLMVRVPDDTPLGEDWTEKLGILLPTSSEGESS